MALLPHGEGFTCLLVISTLLALAYAQLPASPCPSDQCNANYIAQLEQVNDELREAVEKVNRTLAEQKRLINEWKSCKGSNSTITTSRPINGTITTTWILNGTMRFTTPVSPFTTMKINGTIGGTNYPYTPTSTPRTPSNVTDYEAEKLTSLEPCVTPVGPQSNIEGVAQVEGRIFVICSASPIMRVYNATTFQQLPNVSLPIPDFPTKYPSYIIGNRYEKTLYLAVAGPDVVTGEYYGNNILRSDMSFSNWVTLSVAKKNTAFNINRLRMSRNGQMMYANNSHILFPQSATSFSRAINFTKPPLAETAYIQGIVQRRDDSFIFFSQVYNYLIRINSNGNFIEQTATGLVAPTNDNIGRLYDLDQGPSEMLLLADTVKDRVIILDADNNRMTELITKSSGNLWGPRYLSYDTTSQLLVVGELPDWSSTKSSDDNNSLKIFRLRPKP